MRYQISLIVIMLCIVLTGCDNFSDPDSDFTQLEVQSEALAKTWVIDQVILDNFDVTEQENLSDFTITFNRDNTWTSNNGEPVFLNSGTWSFDGANINRINMDGQLISIGFSFDKTISRVLTLSFRVNGTAIGARRQGLNGEYIFRLSTLE